MKFLNILLLSLYIFISTPIYAKSLIDGVRSDTYIVNSTRPFTSDENSVLRIVLEHDFRIHCSNDRELFQFLIKNDPEYIVIEAGNNSFTWKKLSETNIRLEKRAKINRQCAIGINFPWQTYKLREAASKGKKLYVGFKSEEYEVIREFSLKPDCGSC